MGALEDHDVDPAVRGPVEYGAMVDFMVETNDPPACFTGFLPPEQRRGGGEVSVPPTPGDLYCKVVIETPVNLTAEQRTLLEQFEATFSGDGARRHSPKSSTFVDGVRSFWDRMTSP